MKLRLKAQRFWDFICDRQKCYQHTFNKEDHGDMETLADFAKFCHAGTSTFHTDPRISALLEGRREAYLHVVQNLSLNPEELFKLGTGASFDPRKDEDNG